MGPLISYMEQWASFNVCRNDPLTFKSEDEGVKWAKVLAFIVVVSHLSSRVFSHFATSYLFFFPLLTLCFAFSYIYFLCSFVLLFMFLFLLFLVEKPCHSARCHRTKAPAGWPRLLFSAKLIPLGAFSLSHLGPVLNKICPTNNRVNPLPWNGLKQTMDKLGS